MPFGGLFRQEEACLKYLYTFWQVFQYPITYYFCFLERQSSIQLSFLYFYSISKGKKSLKCDNMIIKIGFFCLSSIVPGFTPLTTKISNLRNMHTSNTCERWWDLIFISLNFVRAWFSPLSILLKEFPMTLKNWWVSPNYIKLWLKWIKCFVFQHNKKFRER